MRSISPRLVGLVCLTAAARALFVPQKTQPKAAHPVRPKAPLRCPRMSMFEVDASSSTVVACSQRKPAKEGVFGEDRQGGFTRPDKEGSLGQYLSELTSVELATALESRLSHLITAAPSPSNPDAVVVSLRESFYFGPQILSLWIKPRLVLQFRKQAYPAPSIECACVSGQDADFSERLRLAQLELNCWCTWVEEGIHHLQGNTVPRAPNLPIARAADPLRMLTLLSARAWSLPVRVHRCLACSSRRSCASTSSKCGARAARGCCGRCPWVCCASSAGALCRRN